jgi:nucleoside-diphosphate-sugar epimerase
VSTVLVTGGSGFIGCHCIAQLLAAGHRVQTTVRSADRRANVLAMLKEAACEPGERLRFFVADLRADEGWAQAIRGCDQVLHVASPFPSGATRDENDLIIPAREGTLRILRASRDAGVRRVVLTSSFAAISYGHPSRSQTFDESAWTDLDSGPIAPYPKSKTLAERAAWDFLGAEGGSLQLAVINPTAVYGPVLGPKYSGSIELLRRMLEGRVPGLPRLYFGIVDVRDVAELHLRAMTHPAAAGERFLAVAGDFMSLRQIALLVKDRLGERARRVPTREIPSWALRLLAHVVPLVRELAPELDKIKSARSDKAGRLLGWAPRSAEQSITATAESLLRLGLVRPARRSTARRSTVRRST